MAATAALGNRGSEPMKRAFLLFAAALGSLTVAAARADADSVDTYQVNGTFLVKFDRVDCPAGIPATTNCFSNASLRSGVFPGLGDVGPAAYTLVFDDFGSACGRVHAQIPILVAGKGEIDLVMTSTGCISHDNLTRFPPIDVAVSGGSGRYVGASGSGVLDITNNETGPGSGNSRIDWTGTPARRQRS